MEYSVKGMMEAALRGRKCNAQYADGEPLSQSLLVM
jgi:hypothetical protein